MQEALCSLFVFAGGLLAGHFGPENHLFQVLPTVLLLLLTFVVGVELSTDRSYFSEIKKHSFWVFALPLLIAAGSLLGALLANLLVRNTSLKGSLLVSASLGYYSLASIFISTQYSAVVGGIALLSNIMREIITLLLAPTLVRYFGPFAAIASGAATAMDITLPTIRKAGGTEAVYPALLTGMVLTLLVPILLTLLIRL